MQICGEWLSSARVEKGLVISERDTEIQFVTENIQSRWHVHAVRRSVDKETDLGRALYQNSVVTHTFVHIYETKLLLHTLDVTVERIKVT